uniref:Predicted protein n=1 Tax=Hordeum vulgare subsp. vulgare TaxID=112509 RepID=F2E533_HORVV|nr:predicted protein [Hordeum vulgare subsp. vulgare]
MEYVFLWSLRIVGSELTFLESSFSLGYIFPFLKHILSEAFFFFLFDLKIRFDHNFECLYLFNHISKWVDSFSHLLKISSRLF